MPESYFPLDINFFDHPKVVGLNDKAARLYLSSVAYANRLMTDGFIADAIAGRLVEWDMHDPNAVTPEWCAGQLDRATLWHRADVPCPRGHDLTCPKLDIGAGWRVHDFIDHNRSRDVRIGDRAKERERKAAYRNRFREAQQDRPAGVPPGHVPPGDEVSHRDNTTQHNTTQRQSTPLSLVPSDATPEPDAVAVVFDAWVSSFPVSTRRDLTDARRTAITLALKRYPVEDVTDAARGWVNDPWPERAQQNDIAQLLHMGSRRKPQNVLEKMRDLWRDGPPRQVSKQTAQAMRTSVAMRARRQARTQAEEGVNGDRGRMGRPSGPAQHGLPAPAD